ncbi:MAG: NADP-dependent oxidoreductase [Gammaproteobacteria bacterium]|nr:MAG: NADP-dependent oxidoreductase [Gammaproteobacteria bacterium]
MSAIGERNHRVVLRHRIEGVPRAADFEVVAAPVPELRPGQFLLRHRYISLDPYQRTIIAGRYRETPLGTGDMPPAETVGEVIRSRHERFRVGDRVRHIGGWQEYSIGDGERAFVVDERAPLSTSLGVLGMPGLTAWASAVQLAAVCAGQTALVSAAAGPVGATFGQIAAQRGARAVGIAGSDEKCRVVTEQFGFAACVNYRHPGFREQLQQAVGEGADCYHDNVGGQMLVDALAVLKPYGTVVLCGLITQYNTPDAERRFEFNLGLPIMKRAVMKGLVVNDFEPQRQQFLDEVAPLVATGAIRYLEDRVHGIEQTGAHFARLMRGENVGKALVVLGDAVTGSE